MRGVEGEAGESVRMTCNFLFLCSGYYRYDEGYTPEFRGSERFAGQLVHPQHWADELDYSGKRVVVIGSGATAVTLGARDGQDRRARDDAPTLAHLHRLLAGRRPDRQAPAPLLAVEALSADRALEERVDDDVELPALAARARG